MLTNAIIFCNRKSDVDITAKSLKKYGYDAAAIHGDLDQSHRMKTLDGFRDGSLKLLVASDVAARGLDIPNVSHVFNFDVPSHAEDYVHRIGRTGRAGRTGTAMMICVPRDEKNMDDIERLVEHAIPRLDNPMVATKEAPEASEEKTEEKPKRSRSRSRAKKSEEPKVEAEAEKAPAPAPEETSSEEQKPRRSRGGRGRNRDGGGGPTPMGMGDHMPTFIAKSFEERLADDAAA